MNPDEYRQLDELGYVVLEDFMDESFLEAVRSEVERIYADEGEEAGSEFKQEVGCRRLANLADKAEIFRELIVNESLLSYIRHVLGSEVKLSSLNARSAEPGKSRTQPLHVDMSALPDDRGFWVCNSVWMLDDFTVENGALRLVPGSHRWGKLPQDVLTDPTAPHPDETVCTGRAGTVVVVNSHIWHGGLANCTTVPRRAIHAFYARRDKPQQQYQKSLLRPEVQAGLSPELRALLALDDPLNDAVSNGSPPVSGFMK